MKMRRTEAKSIWAFFLAIFLAIGAAVAILPGCSDEDGDGGDSRSDIQ
jgi:hypothetical protein